MATITLTIYRLYVFLLEEELVSKKYYKNYMRISNIAGQKV